MNDKEIVAIRCNMCYTMYESDEELAWFEDGNGTFRGCIKCGTDKWLMDLYKKDVEREEKKKMSKKLKATPVMRVWLVWIKDGCYDSVEVLANAFTNPSKAYEFADEYQKQQREFEEDESIVTWVNSISVNTEEPEMLHSHKYIVNVDFVIDALTPENAQELVECYIYENEDLCAIPPVINHVDEME